MARTWKIVGLDFSHMHMGDNLRFAHRHPRAEIVGVWDERAERMAPVVEALGLGERVFAHWRECLEETQPDLVLLCPPTGAHARWVERVAPFTGAILVEKPFAARLVEADRMIATAREHGAVLAINWPLAWYPPHVTTKRLIDEGAIGRVTHVNYYDGNRGPLYHLEGKRETNETFRAEEKARSWFYRRAEGGGALLDYLGYGTTLATWFMDGAAPLEVTCMMDEPEGLEVDEHSITLARYTSGLCRFETRWGTFTDPWVHQPQPKCGFEINGTDGTITSYDYEDTVRMQTRAHPEGLVLPVDEPIPPRQDPVQYVLHCLEHKEAIQGPLSPALCRTGQRIVDSALLAAREKRTVELVG